jgi:sugar lactone lactonase YvrE
VLANGGGDTASVAANAATFTLPALVATGAAYAVTVKTQPTHVICSVSKGSGTMGTSAVTNVAVSCVPATYTVGGTITGLGANTRLVLLNNGGDATPISAKATTFTMQTAVTAGSAYEISVGTQPYGITLNCSVSNARGTVSSTVTSVTVDCSTVTPTQAAIAVFFSAADGVAVDAAGNVYVADPPGDEVKEIVAATGAVKTLGSGFHTPTGVAVDAAGNVYVADSGNNALKEIVAATGTVKRLGVFTNPLGVAVDAAGNVYVADYEQGVYEIVTATGAIKQLFAVRGSIAIAVGSTGNVYAANDRCAGGCVNEIVAATGAIISLFAGNALLDAGGVAVDAAGNLYVTSSYYSTVEELVAGTCTPFGPSGVEFTCAKKTLGSGFRLPEGVAVDAAGNVYVGDRGSNAVKEIVAASGAVNMLGGGSGIGAPSGIAVDAAGNMYVANPDPYYWFTAVTEGVKEIVAATGAIQSVGSGLESPAGVAVDGAANVYATDSTGNAVKEIVAATGAINTLGSGFNQPGGVTVDAAGNVYVADTGNNSLKEIVAATGMVTTLGSGFNQPHGVAADAAGNVYVADTNNNAVKEIVAATGAVITLGTGFNAPSGVAVDATGNVYIADTNNNAVKEIVAATGAVITLGSGFNAPTAVALDANGRVYAIDPDNLWKFTP